MALVVESGAGLPDAESYVSVEDADTYHDARANEGWAGDSTAKEAALRRATEYLDGVYRARWSGYPLNDAQALAWPRQYARTASPLSRGYLPSDTVPLAVVRACCECALRELQNPGGLSPDVSVGEQVVQETVGPLSVTYIGSQSSTGQGSTADALPVLVAVDRILAPVLRCAAAVGLVMRA